MASLFKRYRLVVDAATGKEVRREYKKWWGRYYDADNILRRIPLSNDKAIAQRKLDRLVDHAAREKAGLVTPIEKEMKRPLETQLALFERHLCNKEDTPGHVAEVLQKIRKMAEACGWRNPSHISESGVEGFLLHLRKTLGRSIQTSNNYLRAIKSFTNWLRRTNRLRANPLEIMETLNTSTDRRHDRRPLGEEEFERLIHAAETGPPRMGILGRDRAMLYQLAAWTGFRRGELGSLSLRSFDFQAPNATVTVEASYSKHRRKDVQILHPDLVELLGEWLVKRNPKSDDEILFPISKKTCGVDRRTAAMMQYDLGCARRFWIDEADDPNERKARESSEFLLYENKAGLFADFHGLRHTFITNLGKAKVDVKTAQLLARHSDIRLTMDVYTHVDDEEKRAAIHALPKLPGRKNRKEE